MKQSTTFFTESEKAAISKAVHEAEKRTSAEIVPVLATESGRYDRAEDIVGLLAGLLALTVGWLTCPWMHPATTWETGSWPLPANGLGWALLCVVVGFIVGSALASRIPALRLPFILDPEMDADVQRAARAAFARFGVRGTEGSTGVLIYVSLYERRVVVLPDDAIAEKATDQTWAEVRDVLVEGLKTGNAGDGFRAAIGKCADILASEFPRAQDDRDELTNDLHLL